MKNQKTSLLIGLMFVLSASYAFAQTREVPPVTFNKISERLYEIQGGRGASGGFYIGDDSVLLIDAKMDEISQNVIFEKISELTPKPIKYLVNTHSDGDHVNGNRYFPESVTIVAHENCRKEFLHAGRNGAESEWNDPELAKFIPSVTFSDKMNLYLGEKKVELSYYGIGHTTGDIAIYFADEKTAFVGDMFFLERPQLIHSYKDGNSFKYVASVSKMLESTNADKYFIGHIGLITRKQIEIRIEQMKQRQKKVKELIAQNKTVAQIQSEFEDDESNLIQSIFDELNNQEQ